MSPRFGKHSTEQLLTLHPDLQRLFRAVIEHYDCRIVEGYRGRHDQNEAYLRGVSRLKWPESKHNHMPSLAADVVPWPSMWENRDQLYHFAGFVLGVAEALDIPIRWGGDWDRDNDVSDQSWRDLAHFELVENDDAENS